MTGTAVKDKAAEILDAIKESSAILDERGTPLSYNDMFARTLINPAKDKGGFDFASLGSSSVDALSQAAKGHFVETDAYVEVDGFLEGWRAAFIPQPSGNVLMVLFKEGKDSAFYDALTGLPNRHVALERLGREWERWLRSGKSSYKFGIALADIDLFKRINDRFGHDVGDQALKQVSEWFTSSLRAGDWVSRWGGEEFLLFFHDVGKRGSLQVAERCRKMVCAKPFESDAGLRFDMSVSLGVVTSEDYVDGLEFPRDVQQLINDADVLLYDAKHEGRNRCTYRTGSDWLQLDASDINQMLQEGKLEASGRRIIDEGGEQFGTFWQPRVKGMEHRAARHLFQSAIRTNLISSVEAKWIDTCRKASDGDPSNVSFVIVNPNTFQRLSSQKDSIKAIKKHVLDGRQMVLVAKYDPMFGDHGKEASDALEAMNVKSCLWLARYPPTVPTGLLSQLRPAYVLVDEPFTVMDNTFVDLLRIVREYGSTLILHKNMADKKVDYPRILYIDQYETPKP